MTRIQRPTTPSRRTLVTLACVGVAGLIAIGVAELPRGGSTGGHAATRLTAAQTRALLAGSPPALAALHAQGGALLGGGASALHARLAALKGYPVVINKWASWCGPCKAEFGAFQRASARYGRRVAFIGIDSSDNHTDATAFLKSFPVSYPSYYDQSGQMGEQITDSSFTPVTVFIGGNGHLSFIRQGQYPSVGKLERDVERYALNA